MDQKLNLDDLVDGGGDGMESSIKLSAAQKYVDEREEKWKELSRLNKELHSLNAQLMGESSALASRLGELGYYFETRPTLVRSILEMHRLLEKIPRILKEHLGQYEQGPHPAAAEEELEHRTIRDRLRQGGWPLDSC